MTVVRNVKNGSPLFSSRLEYEQICLNDSVHKYERHMILQHQKSHSDVVSVSILRQSCIIPLSGHCIATWYAMFRYLEQLTELETSWGRGDTVTIKS